MTASVGSYKLDLNFQRKDFRTATSVAHGEEKAGTEEL